MRRSSGSRPWKGDNPEVPLPKATKRPTESRTHCRPRQQKTPPKPSRRIARAPPAPSARLYRPAKDRVRENPSPKPPANWLCGIRFLFLACFTTSLWSHRAWRDSGRAGAGCQQPIFANFGRFWQAPETPVRVRSTKCTPDSASETTPTGSGGRRQGGSGVGEAPRRRHVHQNHYTIHHHKTYCRTTLAPLPIPPSPLRRR